MMAGRGFRSHAMAYLIARLFAQHDCSLFEIIGISLDVDGSNKTRKRKHPVRPAMRG
jgi:predicted O-linked N-acetylglucosamine transferase (SPINDLY family)